jgi:hypothetical protein
MPPNGPASPHGKVTSRPAGGTAGRGRYVSPCVLQIGAPWRREPRIAGRFCPGSGWDLEARQPSVASDPVGLEKGGSHGHEI